jgi:eukaryotic-like serine/threonine-protein kinase
MVRPFAPDRTAQLQSTQPTTARRMRSTVVPIRRADPCKCYPRLMIGTSMGRYRIVEPIGQGGMGRVFLAEDPVLGRRLAIKVLPPEFTHDQARRERLLHEARAASALNHPNIVVVHDLGESEGALYIAMELVDGQTLREWARAKSRSPQDSLRMLRQATAALQVAHAAGLVHRDLKPENMLVRRDGLLKILDFGLARSVTPDEGMTATMPGTVMGTAPYMSPEQVLGRPAGPPSDLFSLGTILYELLTGKHPFAAESTVETMHRILHETPDPPSRLNRALTADFDFVLAKALTKDPQRRQASMRDLDVDLETLECGCGPAAAPTAEGTGPRAIAVLPFKNIGGSADLNYLGVGLADAVITRLMNSPDLVVRSTGSIAVYENQPVEPRRVGQELDVTAVLDASFQRAGDRFRATARLVETPSGRALWAGKVDLRFEDIFEVQDQVAHGIAEAMTARLSGEGSRPKKFTPSPEAYELVLRGLEATRLGTKEGNLRAIQEFERAVMLEPKYARAWAHLGAMRQAMVDSGFESDPTRYVQAQEAVDQALALDPEDAQASFATAALHVVYGRKRESFQELLRARRKTPNQSIVYHYIAYVFRLNNQLDEAMSAERHAQSLDPNLPWLFWGMARVQLLLGDVGGAEETMEHVRRRFPKHPLLGLFEGAILVEKGAYEEAVEHFNTRVASDVLTGSGYFDRAFAQFKTGDVAAAMADMPHMEAHGKIDMDFAADAAAMWGHLGNRDKAFEYLDRAVRLGNDTLVKYEKAELFGPLHGDPRWEPFLAAMRRRIEGYRREFRWPLAD